MPRDNHVELTALSRRAGLSVLIDGWHPLGLADDPGQEGRLRYLRKDPLSFQPATELVLGNVQSDDRAPGLTSAIDGLVAMRLTLDTIDTTVGE